MSTAVRLAACAHPPTHARTHGNTHLAPEKKLAPVNKPALSCRSKNVCSSACSFCFGREAYDKSVGEQYIHTNRVYIQTFIHTYLRTYNRYKQHPVCRQRKITYANVTGVPPIIVMTSMSRSSSSIRVSGARPKRKKK